MTDISPEERPYPSRDSLALMRTRLANERTMLAFSRTAIMLAVAGATVLKLYGESPTGMAAGWTLVVLGAGVAWLGMKKYRKLALDLQEK